LVSKARDAINFAQGEFVMIAGFVAAGCLMVWKVPLWLAVVLAIASLVAFGFVLERVMLRKLIGRPVIAVVMATIGLASILRGVGPFTIFSGSKPLPLPIRDEPFVLGPLFIPPIQVLGAGVSLAFLAGCGWFFLKSRKGLSIPSRAAVPKIWPPTCSLFSRCWFVGTQFLANASTKESRGSGLGRGGEAGGGVLGPRGTRPHCPVRLGSIWARCARRM